MYGVSSQVAPYAGLAPEGQLITGNNTSRHIITCMESRHKSHHTLDWLQRGSSSPGTTHPDISSHVWSLITSRTIRWTGSRGAVDHPEQHVQTYHHMYGVSSQVAPYAGLAPEGQLITRNNTSRHIITCIESCHQSHHTLDWLQRGS